MPLLAVTGSILGAMITERNNSRRAAILAMRRVSIAEAKPIVVKFGITKKPTVFAVGTLIDEPVTGAGIPRFLLTLQDASSVGVFAVRCSPN